VRDGSRALPTAPDAALNTMLDADVDFGFIHKEMRGVPL
jgi:hypothetical protein